MCGLVQDRSARDASVVGRGRNGHMVFNSIGDGGLKPRWFPQEAERRQGIGLCLRRRSLESVSWGASRSRTMEKTWGKRRGKREGQMERKWKGKAGCERSVPCLLHHLRPTVLPSFPPVRRPPSFRTISGIGPQRPPSRPRSSQPESASLVKERCAAFGSKRRRPLSTRIPSPKFSVKSAPVPRP